jgi:hypothetical protein
MAGRFDDFLNPNSILTPGIAGGLATTIAMPLAFSFGWSIPMLVLGASLLLSLLIVSGFDARIAWPKRALYCVLNTLIIFSTSIGAARQIDQPPEPPTAPNLAPATSALDFLLPAAHAQTPSGAAAVKPAAPAASAAAVSAPPMPPSALSRESAADADEVARLRAQVRELEDYRRQQLEYEHQTQEYNKRWKF